MCYQRGNRCPEDFSICSVKHHPPNPLQKWGVGRKKKTDNCLQCPLYGGGGGEGGSKNTLFMAIFLQSNCCFRAIQKKRNKENSPESRVSLSWSCFQKVKRGGGGGGWGGHHTHTRLVPMLNLLLIIFCYKFLYMCQFVVEIFTAVPLLAVVGISL